MENKAHMNNKYSEQQRGAQKALAHTEDAKNFSDQTT